MKKLLLAFIFLSFGNAFAQQTDKPTFRINAYGLYAFDDSVDSYYSSTSYYEGKIKGGFEWGGGLECMIKPQYGLELSYLRLDSSAPMSFYNPDVIINPDYANFDVASNYIMLGGNRYIVTKNPKIEPYGGLQLGMAIFDVKNPETNASGSATKFAWGAKMGVNIWATNKVGVKLQAALLTAVQGAGGGIYFGTGGASAGVSTYSTIMQFSLGGGLTFNLGDK